MAKNFLDIKVGDTVVVFDEYLHDYDEHEIKVNTIEYDMEYATEFNPNGKVCYGDDLTCGDDDELMITTVFESNFVRVVDCK